MVERRWIHTAIGLGLVLLASAGALTQDMTPITWFVWGPPEHVAAYEQMIEIFEAAHPRIDVTLNAGGSNISERLTVRIASGTPPDVAMINNVHGGAFARAGAFADLEAFIARDPAFAKSDFFPAALVPFTHKDQLWALPTFIGTLAMHYDRDILARNGVPVPQGAWTWEAFLENVSRLTADEDGDGSPEVYGSLLDATPPRIFHWFYQNGARIWNDDGTASLLDEPAAVSTFEYFRDLVEAEAVPPESRGAVASFINQQIALEMEGPWTFGQLRNRADFEFGIAHVPQGKQQATLIFTDGNAIVEGAAHPEAAWEFVKFLAGPQASAMFVEYKGGIPARRDTVEVFLDINEDIENVEVYLESVEYALPVEVLIDWGPMRSLFTQQARSLLVGEIFPLEAASRIAQAYDTALRDGT